MSADSIPQQNKGFFSRYANQGTAIAFLVIFVLFFSAIYLLVANIGTGEEADTQPRLVRVMSVAELGGEGATFDTVGEVKSQSQADLRAKKAGIITNVYAKVGSRVSAGAVIAAIENAAQVAAVQQAQA
ncbi:MAG: hypothetical protein Q8P16_00585 [bacterium]|nr:hypothetical protein [bacterium]